MEGAGEEEGAHVCVGGHIIEVEGTKGHELGTQGFRRRASHASLVVERCPYTKLSLALGRGALSPQSKGLSCPSSSSSDLLEPLSCVYRLRLVFSFRSTASALPPLCLIRVGNHPVYHVPLCNSLGDEAQRGFWILGRLRHPCFRTALRGESVPPRESLPISAFFTARTQGCCVPLSTRMWSRQETLPRGSTPPHLPGASPGACVQELRLLRPGCGRRKSWISE